MLGYWPMNRPEIKRNIQFKVHSSSKKEKKKKKRAAVPAASHLSGAGASPPLGWTGLVLRLAQGAHVRGQRLTRAPALRTVIGLTSLKGEEEEEEGSAAVVVGVEGGAGRREAGGRSRGRKRSGGEGKQRVEKREEGKKRGEISSLCGSA